MLPSGCCQHQLLPESAAGRTPAGSLQSRWTPPEKTETAAGASARRTGTSGSISSSGIPQGSLLAKKLVHFKERLLPRKQPA